MQNMFFNPAGRLGSAGFIYAGYILILIGVFVQIIALVNFNLARSINLLTYFLIYPWIVIWIKRLHDGGRSGWNLISYLLLYSILSTLGFLLVVFIFDKQGSFWQMALQASNHMIDEAELEAQMLDFTKKILLPSTIVSTLVSLATLHIGDKTIPTDAGENQYGPPVD